MPTSSTKIRTPAVNANFCVSPSQDDEDLVTLSVKCPSTAHSYMLRVPPSMKSCHQAAAWIAGFDNPDDYKPLAET